LRNIAIIPARSGSKGLKDKNIKDLCGKPLMAYSIEAAINSSIFDCVHVSTDSEKYADIAKQYGADVPFLRSENYSTDTASTWDTVNYVIEEYFSCGQKFDMVTILQPTSPLRTSEDICSAYNMFCEKQALSVVSVGEMEHSPLLANTLDESLSLNGFINLDKVGRRQDMPTYYRINGAIYMMKTQVLDNINNLYGKRSFAYVMSKEKSVDIDSLMDFKIAEILIREEKIYYGKI